MDEEITYDRTRYRESICHRCGKFAKTILVERKMFSTHVASFHWKKSICLNCFDIMVFFNE